MKEHLVTYFILLNTAKKLKYSSSNFRSIPWYPLKSSPTEYIEFARFCRGVGNWFKSRTLVPRIKRITERTHIRSWCQIWLQWVQNHGNLALGQLVANPSLLALFLKWSRVCIMHKKQKNCASSISRYKIDRRTGCERKMSLKSN